ncbi:hypothetical protein ACRALDRAFT_1063297 [Sodiomyces alcalophilus JCM 7366]|uniref:uncharacterized protein n=1 Tax=Sodiomyces alcalophilus JCM 7366 TaxID=591952 RepID=UPI0039B58681
MRVIAVPELINLDAVISNPPPNTVGAKGQNIIAAIGDLLSLADELANHPPLAEDSGPRRNILLRMRDVFDRTDIDAVDVPKARRKLATARAKCAEYKQWHPHGMRQNGKTNSTMVSILSEEVIPRLIQREANAGALRSTLFQGDYMGSLFVWWLRQVEYLVSTELEFAPRAEAEPHLSNVVVASSHSDVVQVAIV